jgi:hypothetical protein
MSVHPLVILQTVPATSSNQHAPWFNDVRPWQWLEMVALLVAYFGWLAAVLALGADRPLAGILVGFIPNALLIHVATWFLPMLLRARDAKRRGQQ